MKRFLIILTLFLTCITTQAEVVRSGNTFSVEQTTESRTPYTWKDKDGKVYSIYISKKGACYIKRISKKTGKEYKYYLPKETQAQIKKELGR